MKNYFILICKSPVGIVYPHVVSSSRLQAVLVNFAELDVKVLEVKVLDFNPADYE